MVDALVRDLEKASAVTIDHADLVIVAARASEDNPPAVNAGREGEWGMCGRREGRVGRREGGFDGQPDGCGEFGWWGCGDEKEKHDKKPQEDDPKGETFFLFLREDFFAVF